MLRYRRSISGYIRVASGTDRRDRASSRRCDTHLARLGSEEPAVVDRVAGLVLPLVHHLVQQRLLHLAPPMPRDVPPADGDLDRLPAADVHAQLAESRPHPAGESDGQGGQVAAEVLAIPIYPELTAAQQEFVVEQISAFYRPRI